MYTGVNSLNKINEGAGFPEDDRDRTHQTIANSYVCSLYIAQFQR